MCKCGTFTLTSKIMNLMKLILAIFLCTSLVAFSQEKDLSDNVANYLELNHSLDQYGYAYDQLLKMLENQYPKSNANTEGWKYLEMNKEKTVSEMKQLLIPIYVRNFSQEEIKGMIVFYESDTGRQLAMDRSKMTDEQKVELNSYYNSTLGKKVIDKQPILTQEIGLVSENWSRDLYETAVSLLKN